MYICSVLLFSANAQSDWISNYSINKTCFVSDQDTIKISADTYINGLTQSDIKSDSIHCSVIIFSPWSKTKNGLTRTEKEYEMVFDKRNEDKHTYLIKIPVEEIHNGRYNYEFKMLINDGDTSITLTSGEYPRKHFSVGKAGFISIFSSITTNNQIIKYPVLDFDKSLDFIPDNLEGIYSKGFCIDEYVSIDEFNFLVWSKIPQTELKIETYYSIDGGNFIKSDKFSIIDDSKDGSLSFYDKTYDYDNTTGDIEEYSIKLETEIIDILRKLQSINDSDHKIEFYFKIIGAGYDNIYPENENLVITFKVVNTPTGADCQAALLPIDLLYWDAVKKEKSVYLKWTTGAEINNDYFEIERSSDAKNWRVILKIPGHGDSKEIHNYNANDNYPLPGENYYRLKQTDFDGTNKYSRVKIIKNYENELILYPNPAEDILFYKVTDPSKQFKVEIINSSGKIVETHEIPDKYNYDNNLNIAHLNKGVYLLKYINTQNHQVKILKLIKL